MAVWPGDLRAGEDACEGLYAHSERRRPIPPLPPSSCLPYPAATSLRKSASVCVACTLTSGDGYRSCIESHFLRRYPGRAKEFQEGTSQLPGRSTEAAWRKRIERRGRRRKRGSSTAAAPRRSLPTARRSLSAAPSPPPAPLASPHCRRAATAIAATVHCSVAWCRCGGGKYKYNIYMCVSNRSPIEAAVHRSRRCPNGARMCVVTVFGIS